MARRTLLIGIGIGAVSALAVALAADTVFDGERGAPVDAQQVPTVAITDVVPTTAPSRTEMAPNRSGGDIASMTTVAAQVDVVRAEPTTVARVMLPGLVEVTGVIEQVGDELWMNGRELDFGPDRWITATIAAGDLDGDGNIGTWWQESRGLIGRQVTILALGDDDDLDVFVIDGVTVRPPYSEVPPWSDEWRSEVPTDEAAALLESGITAEQAGAIALAAVPGVVIDIEIDYSDGRPVWDVDLRASDGAVYDVEVDALTGSVLEIDRY